MRRYSVWGFELWRFARSRMTRGALVMLALLPLLYSGLYLWSFWDPYSRLDRVPVALVQGDRGAVVGSRRLHAGRDLEHALLERHTFDWHVVSARAAQQGVQAGSYYMSLEIPPDFSALLASPGGSRPRAGVLRLTTNDANNYVVSSISRAAFAEVRAAASVKTAHSYLDRIFVSFGNLHDAITRAAGGAGRLAAGLDQARAGSGRLASGAAQLAGGGRRLSAGSSQLAAGLGRAAAGSSRLAAGLGQLRTGSAALAGGAAQIAAGTGQLASRVNDISHRVLPALAANAGEVSTAAGAVADAAGLIASSAGQLQGATGPVAAGADRAQQAVQSAVAEADAQRPGQAHPALDAALAAAGAAAGLAHGADDAALRDSVRLAQLQQQARAIQTTAQRVQRGAPGLAGRARRAIAQINRLNSGAHRVAAGAARVSSGIGRAAGGASDLASGVARAHDGALQLQGGLAKLAAGADRLAAGAQRLDGGLGQLTAGAHELARRLAEGAKRVPKYGPRQRDTRADVMSDPVQLAKTALNPAANYGTGFAPYFIPLSLWVGAMVGFTLLRALSARALASNAAPWRVALIGFAPASSMGILQALILLLVLHFLIGLDMARPLGVVAFLVLTVMCFTAINQFLIARFGPGGRLLAIVLLLVQLTSAGGTYPVETSPPFFGVIHPFMPMSYVVRGLRHLISGGELGPVWQACAVLAVFILGSLVLTSMTARRRRVWTVQRLHPELAM